MNNISKLLTEDSMLGFTNGDQIKGAEEVSEVILNCCREYNKAYNDTKKQLFVNDVRSGLVTVGIFVVVGLGVNYIIKRIKKSKSIKENNEEA